MRRRIRRLRRFNWRWTLAFTRRPPGGRTVEGVKYLDCSPEPGGFRASRLRSASDYAWFRSSHAQGRLERRLVAEADPGPARRTVDQLAPSDPVGDRDVYGLGLHEKDLGE